jgi:hypothetical protein
MKITLWRNGFSTKSEFNAAVFLGALEAENFNDAILKYMAIHPQTVAVDRFGEGRHAVCGCEVFDSSEKALNAHVKTVS